MTSLDMPALQPPRAPFHRQFAQAALLSVARLLEAPVRAYRAWRDTEHVMGLSDHLLRDIGVARCEIEAAVRWGSERP